MSLSKRIPQLIVEKLKLITRRNVGQAREGKGSPSLRMALGKFAFEWSGYNRLGLYTDDLLWNEPHIDEALRRLPAEIADARCFRTIRAINLDYLKKDLPRNEWITWEEDLANRYLQPYIAEVTREKREIHEFGCTNYLEPPSKN